MEAGLLRPVCGLFVVHNCEKAQGCTKVKATEERREEQRVRQETK